MRFYMLVLLTLVFPVQAAAVDPESLSPAIKQLRALAETPALVLAVKNNSKPLTIRQMLKLDQKWRSEQGIEAELLIPEAQQVFKRFMGKSKIFVELILIGSYGETLGAMPKTSDYWQGDEAKFKQVMAYNDLYIGPLSWDESTLSISAQISTPIYHDGDIIGVLTGGVEASLEDLSAAKIRE